MTTSTRGDCFRRAFEIGVDRQPIGQPMIDDRLTEWTVVHGVVRGAGGAVRGVYYWHAWCEARVQMPFPISTSEIRRLPVDMAVDYANGNECTWPAEVYLRMAHPKVLYRYTPEEARALVVDLGHWGPWVTNYQDICDR